MQLKSSSSINFTEDWKSGKYLLCIGELLVNLEFLGKFSNVTELHLRYYFPGPFERNIFVGVLRKLSSYKWYQSLRHLRIKTTGRLDYNNWYGTQNSRDENLKLESLKARIPFGLPEDNETDDSEDELDDWNARYEKRTAYGLSPSGELELYQTLISTFSDGEQKFLGQFLNYDDAKAILAEEMRLPPHLEVLDIVPWRPYFHINGKKFTRYDPLQFLPIAFSTINHLKIEVDTIEPSFEESLLLTKEPSATIFALSNIKKLTLKLSLPCDESGMEYYTQRFPNVEILEIFVDSSEDDCSIRLLGAAPALKHITLEWPTHNYHNMPPEEIEQRIIRPILATTTTPALETVTFRGYRTVHGEDESISLKCTIALSDSGDRNSSKITWTGAKEEHEYKDRYEDESTPSWDEDIADELEAEQMAREWAEEDRRNLLLYESSDEGEEEGEDSSDDGMRYKLAPAANEYTIVRGAMDESSDEFYEEDSGKEEVPVQRYQYIDDPEEEGYTQDEYDDEEEIDEGEEDLDREEFQVNWDNPYRTALAEDESGEFGYATQESVYDSLGAIGASSTQEKPQDKVSSSGGEADEKAKEALRIRNLYRR
ncbi:hypothetical protein TWF694_005460 [Orbilia ellipsospora]|uniref:Uncharacterized protein n=1 Tax=Orbilia ellipsospora TaxID=2528407 RepID=A0AAV9WUH4_9PEZI